MYNRYIPQDDGSYRKNRMPDQQQKKTQNVSAPPIRKTPQPEPSHPQKLEQHHAPVHSQGGSITGFLKQLLPKDFDTGDLLIVLLLLLMAGDCQDEQNHALLTLALYFFM